MSAFLVFKRLSLSFLSPSTAAQSCNLHSTKKPKSYFPLLIARPVRGDFSVQGQLTAHPNADGFTWKPQKRQRPCHSIPDEAMGSS